MEKLADGRDLARRHNDAARAYRAAVEAGRPREEIASLLAERDQAAHARWHTPTSRKPHRDFAGYVCEMRNKWSGGHTVICDCKRAEEAGCAIVEDYKREGGRYQVSCEKHGMLIYCANLRAARACMKDPTDFCGVCRDLAGEGDGTELATWREQNKR